MAMKALFISITVAGMIASYACGLTNGFDSGWKAHESNLRNELQRSLREGRNFCLSNINCVFIPLKEGKAKVRKK